jgi:hypothetical protein
MHPPRGVQRESSTETATPPARDRGGDSPNQCLSQGATMSGVDPKTMTAQQRSRAVEAILAVGLLRRQAVHADQSLSPPDQRGLYRPGEVQG